MSDLAIQTRGLSKLYRIGEVEKYPTIREALVRAAAIPLRAIKSWAAGGSNGNCAPAIWALRDLDFEVKQGEVVGIIGRNGAGKSTLLKILSGITEPTNGYADIYGRVGSLLEVGTGFHMELTGRENIFMNGALLGMAGHEIKRKFDEIVAFAETEKFLDTPVKHYSSGMYMRLAFAVAAHLDPEILIVDEVLAVGDASFQKKCLGKIKTIAQEGRTVIFVSHNMAAIRTLCSSAMFLESGRVILRDTPSRCISRYSEQMADVRSPSWTRPAGGEGALIITQVTSFLTGKQPGLVLNLEIHLASRTKHKAAFVAVDISDLAGTVLMQALPKLDGFIEDSDPQHRIRVQIDLPPVIPGQYLVTVWVGSHNTETLDEVSEVVAFEVAESPTTGRTYPHSTDHGCIVPRSRITVIDDIPT